MLMKKGVSVSQLVQDALRAYGLKFAKSVHVKPILRSEENASGKGPT